MTTAEGASAPQLPGFTHLYSGKVRDLYAPLDAAGRPDPEHLLLVASDRISAFDYVLDSLIPDKGAILTQLSLWWFDALADLVPNHVVSTDVPTAVAGRAVLVRRLQMLPVECIARAYLTGSGKAEYDESGSVCGVVLPSGLVEASRLDAPIFTPTSKAALGEHDLPMTRDEVAAQLGAEMTGRVEALTTQILARANDLVADRGILIADTKVEFGLDGPGDGAAGDGAALPALVLADEVLTPDSSRFWPAADWSPGRTQRSYDKQYVRDWLTSPASGWDRASGQVPPPLPPEVVERTRETYLTAYQAITGRPFG